MEYMKGRRWRHEKRLGQLGLIKERAVGRVLGIIRTIPISITIILCK